MPSTPIGIFVGLLLGAIAVGYWHYTRQMTAVLIDVEADLSAIADLKVEAIFNWRRERLGDAAVLANDEFLADAVREVIASAGKAPQERRSQLRKWMEALKAAYGYSTVELFDSNGETILSTEQNSHLDDEHTRNAVLEALHRGSVRELDLHTHDGQSRSMVIVVPLTDRAAKPVGALVLDVDPERFLYPHIQRWPTASSTAETLLIRRDGNDVLFLNPLRHRPDATLSLRFPLTTDWLPAAQAVQGTEGVVQGRDYRGVEVVAAVRRIPDSPWFLVSKIDRSEALAEFSSRMMLSGVLTLLLFGAGGSAAWLAGSRRESRYYRQLYEAEIERKALLSHYEYLYKYANDIILLSDRDSRIINANDRALTAYGYSREELERLALAELTASGNGDSLEPGCESRQLADGVLYETMHRRKDGSMFPVEVSARSIEVQGETFRQSIIRDISERKRQQEALSKTQASLQRAQRIAALGSWEVVLPTEAATEFVAPNQWSDEVYRILGLSPDTAEASDATFLACVHPEDLDRVKSARRRAIEAGDSYAVEHRIVRPGGEVRSVRRQAEVVRDDTGRPVRLVGTIQDISGFKRLEDQLIESQKLESVGMLAGGVAHDFNNLLTVINGFGELALQRLTHDDPLRESLVQIRKAGEQAAALTGQLLAFSRRQVLQPQSLDLNSLVTDAGKMLRRLLTANISLVTNLNSSLGSVEADPGQLHQVIINLLLNARDALPKGGTILVETSNVELDRRYARLHPEVTPGQYVMLAVTDDGIGMDEEVRSRVFEPFFTTKSRETGTGLGLATAYGIVRQSGGWIWVYSEPGKGTTFKVYLPRTSDPARSVAAPETPVGRLEGNESVLIVEDQQEVRNLIAMSLRAYGYHAIESADSRDALRICRDPAETIDLLLTDIVMPHMSGRELAEEAVKARPGLNVLFMSGYTANAVVHRGVLDQGVHYIQKPFTPADLAARIREVLDGPEPAPPLKGRILIVDDDGGVRAYLSEVLSGQGYGVFSASNGAEAVAAAKSNEVDLVITDLIMPEHEGIETIQELKAEMPGLKIIAMSGAFEGEFLRAAKLLGAAATLKKPITPQTLIATVQEILSQQVS